MEGPFFIFIRTIRMTQILMDHEAYFFEIQRNASAICAHCHATAGMAVHTQLFCPSSAMDITFWDWGSMSLTEYMTPLSERLCAPLRIRRPVADFCRHAQKGASRVEASGPEEAKGSFS